MASALMDQNPFIWLSIASVELPDGTQFEQYVMRMRRTATTVVVDDQDRVLLMWRHRFIVDRWVCGGWVSVYAPSRKGHSPAGQFGRHRALPIVWHAVTLRLDGTTSCCGRTSYLLAVRQRRAYSPRPPAQP
jgi:hypothetical protein